MLFISGKLAVEVATLMGLASQLKAQQGNNQPGPYTPTPYASLLPLTNNGAPYQPPTGQPAKPPASSQYPAANYSAPPPASSQYPPSNYSAPPPASSQYPPSNYSAPPPNKYGAPVTYAAGPNQPTGYYPPPNQPPTAQGQYGSVNSYAPPSGPPPAQYNQYGNPANNQTQPGQQQDFGSILDNIIRQKNLTRFYPNPQSYGAILNRLNQINFQAIAAEWRLNPAICRKLAALALYDIIVLCDDSGSMSFEENGSRIDDLNMILERVSQIATLFDDDGILIRFFNSTVEGNGITNRQQVLNLMSQINFNGLTPMGTQLDRKVLQPFFITAVERRTFQKPLLVFVITDGEPAGEPRDMTQTVVANAIRTAQQSGFGNGSITIQFAQVGKDQGAQRFLSQLDNDSIIRDVVDTTSYYELEAEEVAKKGGVLTPEMWLVKLMLGAIDPYFDNQD